MKIQIGLLFKLSIADIQPYFQLFYEADEKNRCEFHILHHKEMADTTVIPPKIDFIFCFGGDGTILRALQYSLHYKAPVLGINLGVVGFLTDLTIHDLKKAMQTILAGKHRVEQKMLLEVSVHSANQTMYQTVALNDVVVSKGNDTKTSHITLYSNKQLVYATRCDGLVVSSPTGATAYSLAAGGPIISPALNAMVATPLNPHSLTLRSIVFGESDTLELHHQDYEPAILTIDGTKAIEIDSDTFVRVKKAKKVMPFIMISHSTYYQKLRKKLMMGLTIKSRFKS